MDTLIRDLRYCARTLARSPGFCAVAALTLAVGIGANTAMFSVVNAMLLRPLPFPNRDRIVQIWATNPGKGWTRVPVSPLDFLDWRAQNQSFVRLTSARFWFYSIAGDGNPEQLHGMRVSPGFFETLGVQPQLGRLFLPEEEQPGRDRAVIITDGLWQRRYAGDPALIGKSISIDAQPFTVVGVLPRDFWFYPILGKDVEIWMPFALEAAELNRDARSIMVHGLLKPGVSIDQARAEMDSLAVRLEQQYPKENKGWRTRVDPGINTKEEIRPKILLLFGAVGLVLLIACANVANLTLARALRRHHEIALRAALGASRAALVRQMLVESALIAALGCAGGLVLGALCLRFLVAFLTPRLHAFFYGGLETLQLNPVVFGFSLGASLCSVVLLGLLPALQTSRPNVAEALKAAGRGSSGGAKGRRMRDALMVSQVALALMLSIGAGLTIRSLGELQQFERGLNTENVLTMQIWLPDKKYSEPAAIAYFYRQVLERLESLPEAVSASAVNFLPLSEVGIGWTFTIEGRASPSPEDRPNGGYYIVAPRFLETLEIPLWKGRYLTEADAAEAPAVAVIDEKLAERYWPGEDPLGKRFRFDPLDAESPWHANLTPRSITVVGVAGTVRGDGLWEDGAPVMYLPYQQNPSRMMHLVIRAASDPMRLANDVQRKVWEIDRDQPVSFVRTMRDVPAWALAERRMTMQLLTAFAALATLLSASGIYGVVSYAVSQRTREVGIRMALGAQRGQVARLVVAQGLKVAAAGVAIGIAGAAALTRFLSNQLYGVTPTDSRTYAMACLSLLVVALLACYLPARRASRVDPITALRHE
jgi:putative ABC transport system permease protein